MDWLAVSFSTRTPSRRRSRTSCLSAESLEPRQLLTAAPVATAGPALPDWVADIDAGIMPEVRDNHWVGRWQTAVMKSSRANAAGVPPRWRVWIASRL